MMTDMTRAKLFRVWLGWSTDNDGNQHEAMRILANTRDEAIDYAKKKMMHPDYIDNVDEWGDDLAGGWSWDEKWDECTCENDPDECVCYTHHYVNVEEIEDYKESDLSLNLLTPTLGSTNRFFDITKGK